MNGIDATRQIKVQSSQVLVLTARGIGHTLGISDRTVQGHLANIFGNLGVNMRTEAVWLAMKQGWIALDETVQ